MNVGVSMYSYLKAVRAGRMDFDLFICEAKEAGAEGVELLDFFYKDVETERPQIAAALEKYEMPCPIFSVSNNFAKATAEEREAQLNRIKFGVDEARKLGAGVVRVFAGDVSEGIGFDQARTWIIEGLAKASEYAAQNNLKLALENHGKLAGRSDQVKGIIDDVRAMSGTDALGANPDTGNFLLVNQPSHEAIRDVAGYAYMVHFKDFAPAAKDHEGFAYEALDGTKYIGTAVGEGSVNLMECIAALKGAGFNGWLSVEYEGEEDPEQAVPRSIANACQYL